MIEATSCGGVVIYRGKILTLYKSYKNRYEGWVLPKGTVEAGEEYKETALREVKEETGLDVKNIRYFGSQPWPYPSGIMVGYYAEYESGTIKLQDEELSAGDFYSRDHLPEIPKKLSIARKLIDAWLNNEI